ncbi:MAG: hypothetical protein V4530_03520 [Pseudomonadota bacterium]
MSPLEFYRTQAAKAAAEAAAATLDNVRERCLRAAAAWGGMAARLEHVEEMRTTRSPKADTAA